MEKEELEAKIKWYEEQFGFSQQRRFGASSEKTYPDQFFLFNEAEATADPTVEEQLSRQLDIRARNSAVNVNTCLKTCLQRPSTIVCLMRNRSVRVALVRCMK
ncbi:hypothetical protein [Siminovitchia thermophila]|uniref:IS66 family transposase n=1 Tax=Siminovitchia thermophila TaxID=1245522 RepID=UPI0011158C3D|nr:hypothetical protein [Siminovitchia thermophila]